MSGAASPTLGISDIRSSSPPVGMRASGAAGGAASVAPVPPAPSPEGDPPGLEALVAAAEILGGRHHPARVERLREAFTEPRFTDRVMVHDHAATRLFDQADEVVDPL